MTQLIQLRDACKSFGEQILLDHASMTINSGQKLAMIGRNGEGKSTLCRVFCGQEELDSGELAFHPDLRLGYLRQDDPFLPEESVLAFLERDSGEPAWRCAEVAAFFAIGEDKLNESAWSLSGGWQTRIKLASLLLHEPNLLILDEPTNFLDLRTQLLLESFLESFRGASLVVSHDRTFLQNTCRETIELVRGRLASFAGDLAAFTESKAQRREYAQRQNTIIVAKMKRLETFIAKHRANPNTSAQARNKRKQLDRMELHDEGLAAGRSLKFRFGGSVSKRGTVFRSENLVVGYGETEVARADILEIEWGDRVAVVGDNGAGKTTLLRSIVGSLSLISGTYGWASGAQIGIYAQHVYQSLPAEQTVLDYLTSKVDAQAKAQDVLNVAGQFLFGQRLMSKSISVLSGGERARLCLAGLVLGHHNVLVLDEPVNHLDVESVDALASALKAFEGTVVFVSHDRHFLAAAATAVIDVQDGRVRHFPAGYESYVYRMREQISDSASTKEIAAPPAAKGGKPVVRGRKHHRLRKDLTKVERQIEKLSGRVQQLADELIYAAEASEAQRILDDQSAVRVELEEAEQTWLTLQEQLEQ